MKISNKNDKKKSTPKKKGKKTIKNSKSRSDKDIRGQDTKGKSKPIRDTKILKVSEKIQKSGRKSVSVVTVPFGKKELTKQQAFRLTKDQLLRLVRKSFTGVTRDFTKADLIFNLYGKKNQAPKRTRKKRRARSNRKLVEISEDEKSFKIYLKEETFAGKIEQIKNTGFDIIVNTYRNKQKLLPRAYMIILVTTNGTDEFDRANKMSGASVSVIASNIKSDIIEHMNDYHDDFINRDDDASMQNSSWVFNPNNISAVIVRFFYAE